MKVNWDVGFTRLGWSFVGFCWLIFFAAHWQSSPAEWGEHSVYMLFFTGGLVLLGRLCRWIVRGFIGGAQKQ